MSDIVTSHKRGGGMARICKAENWGFHVVAQQHSGMSITSYCRKHGLNRSSLYKYRSLHDTSDQKKIQQPFVQSSTDSHSLPATEHPFVKIGTLQTNTVLKVRFPDGAEFSVEGLSSEVLCSIAATLQKGAMQPC
jgi:hypothetical protein